MSRFFLIFKRFLHALKMWYPLRKEFNGNVAFWMCYAYVLPSQKHSRYIEAIQRFFENDLSFLTQKYREIEDSMELSQDEEITIWICWLTGFKTMPEIVRICYDSVLKSVPSEKVVVKLITEQNYSDYVSVPSYIIEKYSQHIISPAHFSDILRFCLLSQYGGMWLDATVYVSDTISDSYLNVRYYTQKTKDRSRYPYEPSHAQWCGFIWAGCKGNLLFSFVRDGLFEYWKKYNTIIDYIFFDYIILTAYNGVPSIQRMMELQEPNNEHIWSLWDNMNRGFDNKTFSEICEKNVFHKLSYKRKLNERTIDGKITFYGYLKAKMNSDY